MAIPAWAIAPSASPPPAIEATPAMRAPELPVPEPGSSSVSSPSLPAPTTAPRPLTRQQKRAKLRAAKKLRITYRRPWLYAEQEQFLFTPKRYSIVEASTKTGKTTGCLVWLVEKACLEGFDGWNGWWVAPSYGQAKVAYDRFKRFAKHLKQFWSANDSELTVKLCTGAKLWFKTGEKPDNLYGDDVHAAVLDEATRMREGAWHAIRTTLTATQGQLRIIGNVKGAKNWCYKLARMAQAGEPDMYYAKLTAWHAVAAGILAAREVLDAKRMLPLHVYEELYLAIPTEDGSNPFGIAAIRSCTAVDPSELAAMSAGIPVIYGIDLAKAVDWTVIIGLDAMGRVCRFHRFQRPWRETMAEIRRLIGSTPALIDSTGVGDPIVELLQAGALPISPLPSLPVGATTSQRMTDAHERAEHEAAVRQRELANLQQACPNIRGFVLSSASKQQLMERLALGIQHRDVRLIAGPGEVLQNELEAFEFSYSPTTRHVRYTAPEGMHDDCVIALALAWEGRAFATRNDYSTGDIVAF